MYLSTKIFRRCCSQPTPMPGSIESREICRKLTTLKGNIKQHEWSKRTWKNVSYNKTHPPKRTEKPSVECVLYCCVAIQWHWKQNNVRVSCLWEYVQKIYVHIIQRLLVVAAASFCWPLQSSGRIYCIHFSRIAKGDARICIDLKSEIKLGTMYWFIRRWDII